MPTADVVKRLRNACFHPLQPADIDVAVLVAKQPCHLRRSLSNQVLYILLLFSGNAREREIDIDERLRQFHQRSEIRKLIRRTRTEEQHQLPAIVFFETAPPFGHRTHWRRPRSCADHQETRSRMIRHQKARTERSNDLYPFTFGEVT